ncbi:hypothetical protein IW261DRAFT_1420933 [Armillaria novae-zelandiae]|uniref:Uncharacterized protein n=1 Tax=Armillaria novae-zelandiae TaxID=153914 RepID=A0AA39P670_9AGAR|nr:hypothetical protein IW261DRAFT_1420933 [Armillaria novae-zelandiae]
MALTDKIILQVELAFPSLLLTCPPSKFANKVSDTQIVGNLPRNQTNHFLHRDSMDSSSKLENSKQEKWHQLKHAYEERNRAAHLEGSDLKCCHGKSNKSIKKINENLKRSIMEERDELREKEDLCQWRIWMNKYDDKPQNMPDDRVYQKGHLQHPEDYQH